MESGQKVGQIEGGASGHHADGNAAAHEPGEFVDGEPRPRGRSERVSGIPKYRRANFRHSNSPPGPVEQDLAELLLELANLSADARLRDVELLCGPRETGFIRHGNEVLELSQFHNQRC